MALTVVCARGHEIGGQSTMGVEMARMYALNKQMKERHHVKGWQKQRGPLPGESGCRLRADLQVNGWKIAIEHIQKQLTDTCEVGPLGPKIITIMEENSGTHLRGVSARKIPAAIRKKYGLQVSED
jgi:hypothetical protein